MAFDRSKAEKWASMETPSSTALAQVLTALDVTRMYLRNALEEVDRLTKRRDELLAAMVRVTNETPFADEAKDAFEQRGKLVAEIGTLRARQKEIARAAWDASWTRSGEGFNADCISRTRLNEADHETAFECWYAETERTP